MMTLETALLAALSGTTTALLWMANAFYVRLLKAEADLKEMREELEKLERENGSFGAALEMYRRCPKKTECPFYHSVITPPA